MNEENNRVIRKFDWSGFAMPRICLTMIVKNESKIIERCLEAALPFIDTWAITDTGSTDGTPDIIKKFFEQRGIQGALGSTSFENFSQARNASLETANRLSEFVTWDYALLVDADMVLEGTLDKSQLNAAGYMLAQHNGHLSYWNTRLVRRDANAKYVGVTHEYIEVDNPQQIQTLRINDHNDGGSKSDKGPRDIRLLKEGLLKEPANGRYMFYLAQVYREMGMHEEAIPMYRERIAIGGWDEEIWASYYGIAHSQKQLGNRSEFIAACLDAYNYRPGRGESLKLLARYFRDTSQNESALIIADALAKVPFPGDHLFVEPEAYDFGALQESAIAGFWSKSSHRKRDGYYACAALTIHRNQWVREEALKNFTYYVKSSTELLNAELKQIQCGVPDGWAPMNPSVCVTPPGQRFALVRTVNYKISSGEYPTNDGSGIIRTKNYLLEMDEKWDPKNFSSMEDLSGRERSTFPVEGFEDCRLWWSYVDETNIACHVSATVRDQIDNSDGRCEMVIGSLDPRAKIVGIKTVRDYEPQKTQKNWMPIIGRPGDFLYLCDPTIVIRVSGNPGEATQEICRLQPPDCFLGFRGGSQLIPHEQGWLCIVHEVTWRPERVYLHRFVKFDRAYQIESITEPFYFKEIGIEFCAGLARDGNRLIASFGVNDASANLAFFDPETVQKALRPVRQ